MRHLLVAAAFALIMLTPTTTGGMPMTSEPTPENGCVFADAVLKEIDDEEARLYSELVSASMARKVVLTVQVRSGDNLRKSTHTWKQQNCVTL